MVNLAAKKAVPTMPSKEVPVGDMELIAPLKRAAMMDALTEPSKEVSVGGMARSVNLAAKKDVQT